MTVLGGEPVAPERTHVSGRRYVAHLVDGVVFAVVYVVGILVFALLPAGAVTDALLAVYLVAAFTVGQVLFFVALHGRTGQTPGKRLVGVRVIDGVGGPPSRAQLVKRSVPLILEYLYVIALVGMLSSPYRQRFGDRWAGTYVVDDR